MRKTSLLGNSLIWFGAAVSVAEILTGALLAPLGWGWGSAAIVLGHAVGSLLLYCAGLIGAKHSVTAMECVKRSFGSTGGKFFALLNLIQLLGWTAVMIAAGAASAHGILPLPVWAWSCIIGAQIVLWIALKTSELKELNLIAVALLFCLSAVLSFVIFQRGHETVEVAGTLSFGEALELSIAMPLSWLPLIADYTCSADRPKLASALSAGIYFIVSCWMYLIGLGAALFAGSQEITQILSAANLGVPALLIVIFSTVTTTYLDVYSSEMSMLSITPKAVPLAVGIAVTLLGVIMAIFCRTGAFEAFLCWIGSVFAPMIAIQIADFFFLKDFCAQERRFKFSSLLIWAVGFLLYRVLLAYNPLCGSTIPVMAVTALLRIGYKFTLQR